MTMTTATAGGKHQIVMLIDMKALPSALVRLLLIPYPSHYPQDMNLIAVITT